MGCFTNKWNGTIEIIWPLESYGHRLWGLICALVKISSPSGPGITMAPLHSIILYFEAQPVDYSLGQRSSTGAVRTMEEEGQFQRTPWLIRPLLYSLTCGPWGCLGGSVG